MVREIEKRFIIRGQLTLLTPLHVGGFGESLTTDMPVTINGAGNCYVPGTSIAGALRGWCERVFDRNLVDTIFGYNPPQGKEKATGQASYLIVEDAVVANHNIEIRDSIGIDRLFGTAAHNFKFDRATITKGSRIPLNLSFDIPPNHKYASQIESVVGHLLIALESGDIRLGAARSRGLGRVQLCNISITEEERSSRTGILNLLKGKSKNISVEQLRDSAPDLIPKHYPTISFLVRWRAKGPLMCKAGYDGIGVDMLPLTSIIGNNSISMVLPGSSIKGAIRSQAERIMRTLLELDLPEGEKLSDQIKLPLIDYLFGAANEKENVNNGSGVRPGLAALSVDDCFAQQNIPQNDWQQIIKATDEIGLRTALDNAELNNFQQSFHVAIDRWTSSAADGALFSTLEPYQVTWQDLHFTLDISRLSQELYLPGVTLILLLLRDLWLGRIPLGYAVNRGMGEIEVTEIVVNSNHLPEELLPLTEVNRLTNANYAEIDKTFLNSLIDAWKVWLNSEKNGVAKL